MSEKPLHQGYQLRAAGLSDPGRVRRANEDAYLVDLARELFVVSDGMGGQQAGELASKLVVTVLPGMIEKRLARAEGGKQEVVELALRDAIADLSDKVRRETATKVGLKGTGATVVLALIRGSFAHIANMGDSRCYLCRGSNLDQLTEDHSIVGILLREGEIAPEEAKEHPARGQLSRYVGMEGDVHPDVRTVELAPGDRLLLCTDGLTGMVDDDAVARILSENAEPEAACRALVDAANAAGGKDNITVVVADVLASPDPGA